MSNQNKAQKATIAEIKDKLFEIPPYQRLYEWESIHIETLLDDMKKAHLQNEKNKEYGKPEKSYFIGNITTSKKDNKFVLIDGQQRLTTLWFIGFYLASRDCGEWQQEWKEFIFAKPNDKQDKTIRISMPIRDKEREALENLAKKIQKSEIKPNKEEKLELSKDLQGIHQKIIDAFGCIESWFNENFSKDDNKKEIDFERLNCFANFIYTKVCFVFVELAENTDLNRFFVRMNNRGKQLEKHEILKARILSVIQKGGGEWQKCAKIWDLCSDMNKYIFQSVNDRNIFEKESKDNDTPDKVESIIDFPTFLLHCYKLWIAKKCNENKIPKEITITKDKLLEIMWDNQTNNGKNKEVILDDKFIFNDKNDTNGQAKANCKEFIIDMLRYRVLFDYFVIKNNAEQGNGFRIRRLQAYKDKNQKTYYRLPEDSKSAKDSPLHNLTMIQNYLRVARQGDRQNYHHWLTPFLGFLDNHIRLEMNLSLMKNCEFNFDNFKCDAKKIANQFSKDECNERQKVLVRFLENLDTKLAIKQTNQTNDNGLLGVANEILGDLKSVKNISANEVFASDKSWDSLLNNGTGTPHYWFYRLEYYLWKWGTLDNEVFETQWKEKFGDKFDDLKTIFNARLGTQHKFKSIAKNFYFRNLNSVEHFHSQHLKKQNDWEAYIDYFGNLALISGSTNSQYSDQPPKEKKEDLKNKLNKKGGNTESLKFFLMCAQCEYDKDEWEYKKNVENKHEKYMLDILTKSLGLNQKDLQNSSNSKGN